MGTLHFFVKINKDLLIYMAFLQMHLITLYSIVTALREELHRLAYSSSTSNFIFCFVKYYHDLFVSLDQLEALE
jgi:hypothetical protein